MSVQVTSRQFELLEQDERRVALINQKHDTQLTRVEECELNELQQRAYRHRERVAPVRNDVLRLLAEALILKL